MFTKLRKWAFNICSECEQPAKGYVFGVRYCQKHLNAEFQRVMEIEARWRCIEEAALNNAHVIKWCRYNHWGAMQGSCQLSQMYWATQERIERNEKPRT
ncbi:MULTISPECIES: hypothetical protein [unclassified Pseudoalteromonas]|uniref:hypothetical protein n=1 Tax=unclassified Pseudoalteromonas TaxID=194690 RepID=UPI0015FA389C|nr:MULTISPECIES: hypothetical protein [unclassified Pseudoalteromonas]MBB1290994.1 hypothetical protein [Pseudoalteromonas sp. SR41-5]MBB1415304.1 hypothetical protein [Pseudoalteromonas sp. SG43-8]